MGIVIILFEMILLTVSSVFIGRLLTVNPEQMDWLKKYQEAKSMG
jgi:hypothetical protein